MLCKFGPQLTDRSAVSSDRLALGNHQYGVGEYLLSPRLTSKYATQFINLIASEKQMVGNGLHSCTHEISVVETIIGGKPVVIIDTPGIDNIRTGVKEADVLKDIADQLAHT